VRMTNPNLSDRIERVGRDHARKLGIEDRLYGTMVVALQQELTPVTLALGAAAGVLSMIPHRDSLGRDTLSGLLRDIWGNHPWVREYGTRLVDLTWRGVEQLRELGIA
jgi:mannitol-1-phosphate/altronate dehydrogenase